MSHFTVLVVSALGQYPTDQLAPFDENLEAPAQDRDEIDLDALAESWQSMADRHNDPERERRLAYVADIAAGKPQEALDAYYGEGCWRETYDHRFVEVSHYSPQSKWDWWTVGGRWAGQLILKGGIHADQASLADLDIEAMRAAGRDEVQKALDQLDAAVAKHGPIPSRDWIKLSASSDEFTLRRQAFWDHPTVKESGVGIFGSLSFEDLSAIEADRDAWLDRRSWSSVVGFALLTHTGDWLEQGSMGWFGCSDTTADSLADYVDVATQYLTELVAREDAGDFTVTLADCHI